MTEDKARAKYCPLYPANGMVTVSTGPLTYAGASVSAVPARQSNCMASDCMMWRWHNREPGVDSGYCGLAGPTS